MSELEGKIAIVTGAASGIGRAGAELMAAAGALVVAADIDDDGAAQVVAGIEGSRRAGWPVPGRRPGRAVGSGHWSIQPLSSTGGSTRCSTMR